MAFTQAYGYQLFIKEASSADDTPPSASTGMTELLNCTDAGIQIQTQTQNVVDYSTGAGFAKAIATEQSYDIQCAINLDLMDAGYQLLKSLAAQATAGKYVQFYRVSPTTAGNDAETHAGIAQVTNFQEQVKAGSIAAATFVLKGYGSYVHTPAAATAP